MSQVTQKEINDITTQSKMTTNILIVIEKENTLTRRQKLEVLINVLKIKCLEEEI